MRSSLCTRRALNPICCCCLVAESCVTPPGVYGTSQARILEWVVIYFSKGSFLSRDQTCVSCTGRHILYHWATRSELKVAQLCPTLCDPMDCSQPSSSVHGLLQARVLEWAVNPFSRVSSWRRNQTQFSRVAGSFFTIWPTRVLSRSVGSDSLQPHGL